MLKWVDRFREHGKCPEDGGLLSQSQSFIASLDLMAADMARWDAAAAAGK